MVISDNGLKFKYKVNIFMFLWHAFIQFCPVFLFQILTILYIPYKDKDARLDIKR